MACLIVKRSGFRNDLRLIMRMIMPIQGSLRNRAYSYGIAGLRSEFRYSTQNLRQTGSGRHRGREC